MFGMREIRDCGERHGRWAAGRHGKFGPRHGHGGGHGHDRGDRDWFRVGRMLAHGDL